MKKIIWTLLAGVLSVCSGMAQQVEPIPFGDFDQWLVRRIKESFVIGGHVTSVYVVAPTDTLVSTNAYVNDSGSPWASSNVMAKVAGVVKTSVTVFPEERDGGYCAGWIRAWKR